MIFKHSSLLSTSGWKPSDILMKGYGLDLPKTLSRRNLPPLMNLQKKSNSIACHHISQFLNLHPFNVTLSAFFYKSITDNMITKAEVNY